MGLETPCRVVREERERERERERVGVKWAVGLKAPFTRASPGATWEG